MTHDITISLSRVLGLLISGKLGLTFIFVTIVFIQDIVRTFFLFQQKYII